MSTSEPGSFLLFMGLLVDNDAPLLDADDDDGSADLSTGNTVDAKFVAPKRAVADAAEDFVPAVPVRDEDGDEDGLAGDAGTEDVVAVPVDDDDADSLVNLPDDGDDDTGGTANADSDADEKAAVRFGTLTHDEEARGESVAGLDLHSPLFPLLCALSFLAFSG